MTREAANYVFDYAEEQGTAVQITLNKGEYIADFQSNTHAQVCYEEMIEKEFNVTLNPPFDPAGVRGSGGFGRFYARIV